MSGKGQSMLTEAQREYLRGESNPSNPSVIKGRIRERIYNSFRRDGAILLEEISPEERREIFRYWQDEEADAERGVDSFSETYYNETMEWAEKGSFEINLPRMLAFLYLGLEESSLDSFPEVLEHAMNYVAQERDEYVSNFNFHVEFEDQPTAEDIFQALKKGNVNPGQLSIRQLTSVVNSDTVDWQELPAEQQERIIELLKMMESASGSLEPSKE